MRRKRKIITYLLSMALMLTSLPVQLFAQEVTEMPPSMTAVVDTQTTTPGAIDIKSAKYVGEGYEVEYKVTEQKEETFTGKFALTNTGTYDIQDWSLQFDFQHEILDIQNANILEQDGTQCILQATSNTNTISQGQTIEIIFEATYSEFIQEPTIYILDEEINYQNCPEDEEAYKIWKENILKKEQRKRNNSRLYEMSMFAVTEPTTGSISNEYIQFNYLNGYHGVVTTGGNPDNPNDDNKLLIYGGGSTSYTTIRIDGNNYEFSPDTVTRYDNKIIGTKRIGDIIVSQHIGIIPNQYTGRDDVVEFFYTVENTSDTPHDVGVRIMFDTMLGNNDSAPFRLPAVGDVTTETDLSGEEIPEFWQAFDNLTNPKVIAQGTLKVDKASTPDRVRFTNWRSAVGNPWDYVRPAGSSNGDSAVCLYWNEQMLEKDDTLACKTFYGLSALQQDLRPPLALALTGATKLEVVKNKDGKDEYSPNPFTVTAYIENIGTGTATNTKITLNLPKGMEVVNGQKTVSLGNIPVGTKQYQVSWKINVAPSAVDKIEEYSVTLVADNAEAKTLKREITVPKLQTSGLKLFLDRSSIRDGNTIDLRFKIVNEGKESVDLSKISLKYYFLDESPKTLKSMNCYDASISLPYIDVKDKVKMQCVQNLFPQGNAANAYILFYFDQVMPQLEAGQELLVTAGIYNQNGTVLNNKNDYSYLGNNEVATSGYKEWKYITIYEGEDQKNLIWGVEPSQVDRMEIEGTYFEQGKLNDWAIGNSSFDVSFNEIEINRNNDNIQLSGNIMFNGKNENTIFNGTLVTTDTNSEAYGDRAYLLLDDNDRYKVLSCSVEKGANYIWLQDRNLDLIGKNIFRISLLDKKSGVILDMEGEWTLDDSILENVRLADENKLEQIQEMNTWFVEYTPINDSGIFGHLQPIEIIGDYTEQSTLMMNSKIETEQVALQQIKGGYNKEYTTKYNQIITLDSESVPLYDRFDPTIITNNTGYGLKTYKVGDIVSVGNTSRSSIMNGGYFYYITQYYTGVKYVEILAWSVNDTYGKGGIASPYDISLNINFCESYIYVPKRNVTQIPEYEDWDKNMLFSANNLQHQFFNRQTKMKLQDICIEQEIYANQNNDIPYFKEQTTMYTGNRANEKSAVYILTDLLISKIPIFNSVYDFYNSKKELLEELTAEQYQTDKSPWGFATLDWKLYIESYGENGCYADYNKKIYVPQVQNKLFTNVDAGLLLRNTHDYYKVTNYINTLGIKNKAQVKVSDNPKTYDEIQLAVVQGGYDIVENSDSNKYRMEYRVMFNICTGEGLTKPIIYHFKYPEKTSEIITK